MLHPDTAARYAWTPARELPRLGPDEVQLWRMRVALDGDARTTAAIAEAVTAGELERAARFRREQDRQRFLHGRLLLRTLLGHHLGLPPRDVTFVNGEYGKPGIPRPEQSPEQSPALLAEQQFGQSLAQPPADAVGGLQFNLGHSGEWLLFALARDREVGVDVEQHRAMNDLMDISTRFFAPPEVAALAAFDPSLRQDVFFRIWTRKEAIVKAIGRGISAGLDRFAVAAAPGDHDGPPIALDGLDDDPVWRRWTLHALGMPPGYAAAVAFDGGPATVTRFEWSAFAGLD